MGIETNPPLLSSMFTFVVCVCQVRSYGDLFREGDTIGVSLNMDLGTLRFARNGRDLGVAVQGLEGTLYPAMSMYNRSGRTVASNDCEKLARSYPYEVIA